MLERACSIESPRVDVVSCFYFCMTFTLRYRFPANRDKLGELELVNADGEVLYERCRVLGRSDNAAAKNAGNPNRNPLLRMGDFPLGRYRVTLIAAHVDVKKFGSTLRLSFEPIAGPALQAWKNGRRALEGHAGVINVAYTNWSGLRPTFGCVRHHEDDLACIVAILLKNPKSEIYADVTEL